LRGGDVIAGVNKTHRNLSPRIARDENDPDIEALMVKRPGASHFCAQT
jgi:hypothetical protein